MRMPRYSPLKLKRNEKGETLLHRACIEGNLQKVEALLERGHDVNPRDNAGWTPLHEACNHGHYEMVEMLLDHGAAVNDCGGRECGGITPLHDACSVGHVRVIQLLIERGANVICLDKENKFPVDALREYLEGSEISEEETRQVKQLENSLSALMTKQPGYAEAAALRSRAAARRGTGSRLRSRSAKPSIPALLREEDMVDDWLVKDIRSPRKKKRRVGGVGFLRSGGGGLCQEGLYSDEESSDDDQNSSQNSQHDDNSNNGSDSNNNSDDSDSVVEMLDNELWNVHEDISEQITDSVTADVICDSPVPQYTTFNHSTFNSVHQSSLSHYSAVSLTQSSIRLRITAGSHRFLIPITKSDLDTQTVGWLAEDLSVRYYKLYNVKPQVILSLKDGSKLTPSDLLSHVLSGTDEELLASDIKWNVSSLDKYNEECTKQRQGCCENVRNVIRESAERTEIDCSDMMLTHQQFKPFIHSVCYQNNLSSLNLSGNLIEDEGFRELVSVLPLCSSLRSLDVSKNGLTEKSLQLFTDSLNNHCDTQVLRIEELKLSYNSLFRDSVSSYQSLYRLITSLPYLITLDLSSTRLTLDAQRNTNNTTSTEVNIEHLDVSNNRIRGEGLMWLLEEQFSMKRLKRLNVSRCLYARNEAESQSVISTLQSLITTTLTRLSELNVSRIVMGHSAVQLLCRLLEESVMLESLVVSGCEGVDDLIRSAARAGGGGAAAAGGGGLRTLSCADCSLTPDLLSLTSLSLSSLTLTASPHTYDQLSSAWTNRWQHRAKCLYDDTSQVVTLTIQ